jgi:hypothetical protein
LRQRETVIRAGHQRRRHDPLDPGGRLVAVQRGYARNDSDEISQITLRSDP